MNCCYSSVDKHRLYVNVGVIIFFDNDLCGIYAPSLSHCTDICFWPLNQMFVDFLLSCGRGCCVLFLFVRRGQQLPLEKGLTLRSVWDLKMGAEKDKFSKMLNTLTV